MKPPEERVENAGSPGASRVRFSLRFMIVVVGVGCLVASNLTAMRDITRLREENDRLRSELGYLTIQDRDRFHLVAAPQIEDWKWRWRVYAPPQREFTLFFAASGVGDADKELRFPFFLSPGEYTLTLAVTPGDGRGSSVKVMDAQRTTTFNLPDGAAQRLGLGQAGQEPWQGGVDQTVNIEPGGQIVLLEPRSPESHLYGGLPRDALSSWRVWIEETSHNRAIGFPAATRSHQQPSL